jgi:hypothetical protein
MAEGPFILRIKALERTNRRSGIAVSWVRQMSGNPTKRDLAAESAIPLAISVQEAAGRC